jgi:hypothetical protein
MAAIAMLCVSAVMLTGVSYAWFTLSTNPEVTNITANVSANENLEIALDNGYSSGEGDTTSVDLASKNDAAGGVQGSTTGNPYTWGNLVNLSQAFETINSTSTSLQITPVTYKTAGLKYPEYGKDGRVSGLKDLKSVAISDYTSVSTPDGGVKVWKKTDNSTVYDALEIDYWLRSNENCNVSLSEAAKRANSDYDDQEASIADTADVNAAQGAGSYIVLKAQSGTTTTDNSAKRVRDYAKNLVIRFDVYTSSTATNYTSVYASLTEDTTYNTLADDAQLTTTGIKYKLALVNGLQTASTASTALTTDYIALDANTAKLVKMYVYLDGETVTNAAALLDTVDMEMNIQFSSSAIGGTNDTPGAMDGATVTTTNTSGNN